MSRAEKIIQKVVYRGYFDCGLTGKDWVQENGSDVIEVSDLIYSRASNRRSRWIIAVPQDSPVKHVKDLEGKEFSDLSVMVFNQNKLDSYMNYKWQWKS